MNMLSMEGTIYRRWNEPPPFDFAKVQEWLKLRCPKYPEIVWIIKADMPWLDEQLDYSIQPNMYYEGRRHNHRIIGQDWEFLLKVYTPSVATEGIHWVNVGINKRHWDWRHNRRLDHDNAHVEEMMFQHMHERHSF